MQTFNLIAYNNATFRWTLDVSRLSDFFAAGGVLHMTGTFPSGTSYEWIQGAASGGIINVSSAAGVYTALFTAPLKDTSLWFGKMTFDCRGELPSRAAIPIMSGAIDFRQGKTRRLDDASSTSISTIYDTVEGSAPELVLPVDWTATLNAARGYASDAAASADSAASMAALAAASLATTFRNRLINGNFDIWQRGTSLTLSYPNSVYIADRWLCGNYSGVSGAVFSRVSAPSGFLGRYAINGSVTGATVGNSILFAQRFEARQVADLDGKACVVSFDINATTSAGSLTGQIQFIGNSAVDNGSWSVGLAYPSFAVPVGSGRVSVALSAAQTVGLKNGASIGISLAQNGATGNISATIGAVQFEADPSGAGNASPFEFRPLPVELAMCQRYFQTSYDVSGFGTGGQAGQVTAYLPAAIGAGGYWNIGWKFPVVMRATPTMTVYAQITGTVANASINSSDVPWQLNASPSGVSSMKSNSGSSIAAGSNLNLQYAASAEL